MAAEPLPGWKAAKKLPSPATQEEPRAAASSTPRTLLLGLQTCLPLLSLSKGLGHQQVSSWGGGFDPARMLPARKGSALAVGGGWKEGTPPSAPEEPVPEPQGRTPVPLKDKCPGPRGLQGDQQVAPEGAAPALGAPDPDSHTSRPLEHGPWSTWPELPRRGRLGGRHSLPCGVLSLTGGSKRADRQKAIWPFRLGSFLSAWTSPCLSFSPPDRGGQSVELP